MKIFIFINLSIFIFRKHRVKKIYFFANLFFNKKLLEIGGPSRFFHKNIPIYQLADIVDGTNFSSKTPRDGFIEKGENNYNYFKDKKGTQYICDAVDLSSILNDSYDFVISSNCLEHVANPLKALLEWKRVVKSNGGILLVLPNHKNTFDKNRLPTKFDHILNDYNKNINENDMTHYNEVIDNNAYMIDKIVNSKEHFIKLAKDNKTYRLIHHHVFNKDLIIEICKFLDMKLVVDGVIKKDIYFLLRN